MTSSVNIDHMLDSLSPLDGRYLSKTSLLRPIFSERGLILYRIKVEVLYLSALIEQIFPSLKENPQYQSIIDNLKFLYHDLNFSVLRVKDIESTINHDVKSVEYYIKEKLDEYAQRSDEEKKIVDQIKPFVHFGLTSQDITTLSLWLQLKDGKALFDKEIHTIEKMLRSMFTKYKSMPMLARTHGQPATPTLLGKEFMVFAERLHRQRVQLERSFEDAHVKFGGAIGNFNAHWISYGKIDWKKWADDFIKSFGFKRAQFTTQIDHYDMMGAVFDDMKRINTVLLDLCRDIWDYISRDYLMLSINTSEIGSSTMPHKVNPINFENAEGNLILANALFETFSRKLPVSRMQRDLSDSTVTRNFGVAFGYTFIALSGIISGMKKITPNTDVLNADLEKNYIVIGEAIQSILKTEGIENGYELLKQFTRTRTKPDKFDFTSFINNLNVSDFTRQRMLCLSPFMYTGTIPYDYK